MVIDGHPGDQGKVVPLNGVKSISIGRASECDFVLSDRKISRCHCMIENRDGCFVIVDNGSSNGTIVNGEKIKKTVLQPGDYLRLGFTVLAYQWVPNTVNA